LIDAIVPSAYSRDIGVLFAPTEDYELAVATGPDGVLIRGDRNGLRSLAKLLADLAEGGVPTGHHVHLQAELCLSAASEHLTVVRDAEGSLPCSDTSEADE
jgi:hypothetical protein